MADMESEIADWLCQPRRGRQLQRLDGGFALASVTSPRREANQDRAVLAGDATGNWVAVLADGMGGMVDGAGCAARAAAAFIAGCLEADDESPTALFERAAAQANRRVYEIHGGAGGTTLTALVCRSGGFWLVHAGDTRLYVRRQGGYVCISRDDTALAEIPERQAARLAGAERMMLGAQLRRAVGIAPRIAPTVESVDGVRFLLTSDGLHDYADPGRQDSAQIDVAPDALSGRLLDAATAAGTHDDASVIAIDAGAGPQPGPLLVDAYGSRRLPG